MKQELNLTQRAQQFAEERSRRKDSIVSHRDHREHREGQEIISRPVAPLLRGRRGAEERYEERNA